MRAGAVWRICRGVRAGVVGRMCRGVRAGAVWRICRGVRAGVVGRMCRGVRAGAVGNISLGLRDRPATGVTTSAPVEGALGSRGRSTLRGGLDDCLAAGTARGRVVARAVLGPRGLEEGLGLQPSPWRRPRLRSARYCQRALQELHGPRRDLGTDPRKQRVQRPGVPGVGPVFPMGLGHKMVVGRESHAAALAVPRARHVRSATLPLAVADHWLVVHETGPGLRGCGAGVSGRPRLTEARRDGVMTGSRALQYGPLLLHLQTRSRGSAAIAHDA